MALDAQNPSVWKLKQFERQTTDALGTAVGSTAVSRDKQVYEFENVCETFNKSFRRHIFLTVTLYLQPNLLGNV